MEKPNITNLMKQFFRISAVLLFGLLVMTTIAGAQRRTCTAAIKYTVNGLEVSFTAEPAGKIYLWSFGDRNRSRNGSVTHTYARPGRYEVCVKVVDTVNKCVRKVCEVIQVGRRDCDLKAAFEFRVRDHKVFFVNTSKGKYTAAYWLFGDGNRASDRSPVHFYRVPGIYRACLVVFNRRTGCSDTICERIVIGRKDRCIAKAGFRYWQKDSIVAFVNGSKGAHRYEWSFGDGTSGTAKNPRHVYGKPGIYNVCLIVTDTVRKCRDSYCTRIIIKPGRKAAPDGAMDVVYIDVSEQDVQTENPEVVASNEVTMEAFPNPTSDVLSIKLNANGGWLMLYNMQGVEVTRFNQKLPQGQTIMQLDVSSLPEGTYLLRIITCEGRTEELKFIRQ